MEGARIGKNCSISGCSYLCCASGFKICGEESLAIIGDNCTIRECVTNQRYNRIRSNYLGNNCLIMATAHIAHDCHIGDNAIIVNGVALAGHVTVGNLP
jgi:UDP-N-acetylglucosamine acyltransferase